MGQYKQFFLQIYHDITKCKKIYRTLVVLIIVYVLKILKLFIKIAEKIAKLDNSLLFLSPQKRLCISLLVFANYKFKIIGSLKKLDNCIDRNANYLNPRSYLFKVENHN